MTKRLTGILLSSCTAGSLAAAALLLSACGGSGGTPSIATINKAVADPLLKLVTQIGNAGLADLKQVEAIASVPNPNLKGGIEDADGLACAVAATAVFTQIQAVNAAASSAAPGATAAAPGTFTLGEMASLFKPGSPQYTDAANTLAAGCVAKANDVMGPTAVVAAGGVLGAMVASPAILPLAAGA